MARTQKKGISYFSFDVDFFADRKIKILKTRFGADGIMVYIYLLTEIYKNGYYMDFDDDFEYIISSDLNMDYEKIGQIINFLLGRSLFDDKLFKSDKVLTSHGIQQRFQEAVSTRGAKNNVEVDAKYWTLKKSETKAYIKVMDFDNYSMENNDNSMENNDNSTENNAKESKVNEIKVNENREKESVTVVACYEKNVSAVSPAVAEKIDNWLKSVDASLIIYAIEEAAEQNKRTWKYINGIIKNQFSYGHKTRAEAENTHKGKEGQKPNSRYDFAAIEKAAFDNVTKQGGN